MSGEVERKPFRKNFQKGKPFNRNSKFRHNNGNRFRHGGKKGVKRFMSNAKGFGKKGNYGRGTHIEEDQFSYFIGILDSLRKPTCTAEERVNMSNNVLEQTKGNEIHLASNQIVSKTLEALLGFTDPEHLERFFEVFGENFRPICSDPFASHVLQKAVEIAFIRAMAENKVGDEDEDEDDKVQTKRRKIEYVTDLQFNLTADFAEDHRIKCSEFVQRVSKFLLNNLEDFVWDTCGSHLIRLCIMCLSGMHIPKASFSHGKAVGTMDKINGSKASHHKGVLNMMTTIFQVPGEWTELMKEFPSRLEMWPQFSELPYKEQSSGLIGVICVVYSHVDKSALKHFGKKLLNEAFVDVQVPENQLRRNKRHNAREENGKDQAGEENSDDDQSKEEKQSEDEEEEEKDAELENEEEEEKEAEPENDNDDDAKDDLPSVFKTDSSVRLMETLMSVAGPKLLVEIYNKIFAGRILDLAIGRYTNFPVQRLLNYIKDKSVFETIFDELVDHIEKLIEVGSPGVVGALSGACLRLNTKQAALITALQTALHCSTAFGADRPKSFFACLLKMKPFEVLPYDKAKYVVLYGSLIIQDILQYNKPIFLVNCILETPPKDLVNTFQLPNGCFIADVFLKSNFIGEKSREKFIKLFDGFYLDLALGRCGSRALEKFFNAANETLKLRIAKDLMSKENKLRGTVFGRIVFNVLRLETFKLSPDQWKASWTAKPNKGEEILTKIVKKKRPASKMI